MTCGTYAQPFVDTIKQGQLINPGDTSNCGYCQYASGVEFLQTLNIEPGDKWRNLGIFLGFCISNWALVYFFIYTVRIRGWNFGFGYIFKFCGKVMGLFKRKVKKQVEEVKKEVSEVKKELEEVKKELQELKELREVKEVKKGKRVKKEE